MTPGYDALLNSTALLVLSTRGRVRVTGEDRARLLHAMTTNHVQQLRPGEGLYAFFLNAQGRILADVCVLCFDDHLLLDTEPESRTAVAEHLDRYIIADDATVEDITAQTFCFGLEGPAAFDLTSSIGLPAPRPAYGHIEWGEFQVASISFTGQPAVRIYGPANRREELLQKLEGAGALAASDEDADRVRLRNFKPRHGVDFTETTLPQETQQMHALHFQKGCYLGQEIVERIRSRGHVNRQLMGFRSSAETAPAKDSPLTSTGKPAGEVTSAALLSDGMVYGLAFVRVPYNKAGGIVEIAGTEAEILLPFNPLS